MTGHDVAAGLSGAEASARLERDGPNILPSTPPPAAWRQLAAQMGHFFALMLWVAGVLAFVAGLPQLGVAIFVVIVVNGVFAFVQESRAEHAAERLRDLLPRRAMVLRDGSPLEIDAAELVVDDLVLLEAGDRVSADLRLVDSHALVMDTSLLTGESAPVPAATAAELFAGTFVVEGEGRAVVEATGSSTRLAAIAQLTRGGQRPRSPLAHEIDRVVRTVAFIAIGVGIAFFGVALAVGSAASDGFLFAIGVTVALVPEGLLPTVTLSLAMGAQRMAGRHTLVRRLESVETLGSTTFICTDKTGTLTRNEMSVVEVWTPAGTALIDTSGYDPSTELVPAADVAPSLRRLARAAALCSSGRAVERDGRWVAQGDPMEAAIDTLSRRLGVAADDHPAPILRRFPFDPRRRRMSIVTAEELLVKGATDSVLPRCVETAGATQAVSAMAGRGLRVLAVAARPADEVPPGADPDTAEDHLELLGLIGLEDPPRASAADAIAACRRAGIRVAMVTGDHPATARAIAAEVGLLDEDGLVLEGKDLPSDQQVLGALLDREGVVLARVAPEDKLRITSALQARGHVVAMTGDGVNDGPALQAADIGIAMGRSGTDVAREAADLVLLDDDFATIVAAVEQGRATFSNVHRFLTYHLTDNVAELTPFVVWALSGGRFPLALGVLQILCLDIGTDLLPALALGAEAPNAGALAQPPLGRHLIDGRLLRRVFGVLGPAEAFMEMTAFLVALGAAGWRPGDTFPSGHPLLAASGAAFAAVVIGQAANAFACRSATRWPGALGWTGNRLLLGAVAVELALLSGFLLIGPIASLLDHAAPPAAGLAVALLTAPVVLLADAAHKRARHAGDERATERGPSALPGSDGQGHAVCMAMANVIDHTHAVEVFADLRCPFAHVGLRRLVEQRDRSGGGRRRFWIRAWPLEMINDTPLDGEHVADKIAALRDQVAPELFSGFRADSFPTTSLPAFATCAAAYRRSDALGEAVSLGLRDELFEEGHDISDETVLASVRSRFGLPTPTEADWLRVDEDWADGQRRGVVGSPHFFVGDRSWFCPTLQIAHVADEIEIRLDQDRAAELLHALA